MADFWLGPGYRFSYLATPLGKVSRIHGNRCTIFGDVYTVWMSILNGENTFASEVELLANGVDIASHLQT